MTNPIAPHGGVLINCFTDKETQDALISDVTGKEKLLLNERAIADFEMIATGAMSPLTGFMGKADFDSVLDTMRLSNGLVWSLPIILTTDEKQGEKLKTGENYGLYNADDKLLGSLKVSEIYSYDKKRTAMQMYGTDDDQHPGVQFLYKGGNVIVAGDITAFSKPQHEDFNDFRNDPAQTRAFFAQKGWKKVVAFQTRNPIHRAHEYIQKCALEICDGLMIHPLVGHTKGDDLSAQVRMKSYRVILDNYFPKDRTFLSVFPAAMRYAGPKEAVFHALVRKNYGCTHFIVGRDHAGVGSYYGSFDAHYIFDEFEAEEIGITPLFFDYTFYCKRCNGMASFKSCPHDSSNHIALSGTQVRKMLYAGEVPPPEFSRPEVVDVLIKGLREERGIDFCI